jgi:hypothetical protein
MDIQYRCLKCLELLVMDSMSRYVCHVEGNVVIFYGWDGVRNPLWQYLASPSEVTLEFGPGECLYVGSYEIYSSL